MRCVAPYKKITFISIPLWGQLISQRASVLDITRLADTRNGQLEPKNVQKERVIIYSGTGS